jgi:hypothetical protein
LEAFLEQARLEQIAAPLCNPRVPTCVWHGDPQGLSGLRIYTATGAMWFPASMLSGMDQASVDPLLWVSNWLRSRSERRKTQLCTKELVIAPSNPGRLKIYSI